MEEKINIAELLKDCPKGMELDCILFNNPVKYGGIEDDDGYPITILSENDDYFYVTKEGYLYNTPNSKCVIFPKGKTTWEGFVPLCKFKDGDIISNSLATCIFKGEGVIKGTVDYYCGVHDSYFNFKPKNKGHYGDIDDYSLATEEEKQKLFDAIKANGFKWNAETKTLETLPKDKFDIDTLVPFESRVLVRDVDGDLWKPAIFGFSYSGSCYGVGGFYWKQCIPYESNENLLGTTHNCDEYYKTWE